MTTVPWLEAVRQAASLDLERVSAGVVEHAGRVIADTVGVSAGGHRSAAMRRLLAGDDPLGPLAGARLGASTVLGAERARVAPELAAYLNATAGSFLEMDEGIRPTGHPGMQTVIPALAVAEAVHASGADLVAAVLAGYEMTFRLFQAFRLTYPAHPHGHFGAVGAAVAVARLTGADPVTAATIAATAPILSTWPPCYEGATARNTWMGQAAHTGVLAIRLARAGFTGSEAALPAAFDGLAGQLVAPEALTAPLDYGALGITRNYFKRHSACALTHGALDAVLALSVDCAAEVTDVRVETVQNNLKLDHPAAANSLSARFSLPYAVATAVLRGRTDPAAFEYDDAVAAFAARVHTTVAPDLEAAWPAASPVRVTITTARGEVMQRQVNNPHGYHSDPLTDAELQAKFADNIGAGAERLWTRLTTIVAHPDCADLFTQP